jgi:serine/threonine protein kinase
LENNFYLVTEYIEGESLDKLLIKRKRRLSIKRAHELSIKLSALMTKIHSAGWVWRDCKPANIIVTKNQNLRPVDFEGAGLINEPPLGISGTPGFLPPESIENHQNQSSVPADLYALGAVFYYLFTGQFYSAENSIPVKEVRRNVPLKIQEIIAKLLGTNRLERPEARIVERELETELKLINDRGNRLNKAI